jgi:ankyrin repeat protein
VFIRVYPWLLLTSQLIAADPISDALQKGLFEEEANHNLDAAIKAYQSVIDQSAEQRKLTATAVFRLGECYRKLNKTNEALAQYQRVVREFPDVPNLATLSQQNLAALGLNPAKSSEPAAATSAEAEEIEKIKAMIKYSPDLINAPHPSGQTPLSKAALSGFLGVARFLLDSNADVDARDYGGSTPLHRAAQGGHRAMVELLLDRGADVNATDKEKNQPLHLAASQGYPSIVELLITRKADVNGRGESSRTPLHVATKQEHVAVAKFLLDRGAEVNVQDSQGWTALHYAAMSSLELMKVILAHKPDLNVEGRDGVYTPLIVAARQPGNDTRAMELLLQAGADANKAADSGRRGGETQFTPLMAAAVHAKSLEKVRLLLQYKADPNPPIKGAGGTVLGWVVGLANTPRQDQAEYAKIADLLRKHGAKAEGAPATASGVTTTPPAGLSVPVPPRAIRDPESEEIQSLQRLIRDSPDLINGKDGQSQTALHRAAAAGQTNVLLFLLTNKAEVNIKDKQPWGSTPLHKAVMQGQKHAVELLLAHGADVNAWGSEERDHTEMGLASCHALHMAVKQGNQAITEILINAKADVNGRDYRGRTPLHFAVHQGYLQLVRLLISKGADPNVAEEQGRTPAMLAVDANYENIFNFLLEQGIDLTAQNKEGLTLLHKAAYQRPPRIMQAILARKPDLEIEDKAQWTPLMSAMTAQNIEAARLLLEAGADPNHQNSKGFFALFIAADRASKAGAELLLKYKADTNRKNLQNVTALEHALGRAASAEPHQQKSFREVAELLRKHGAKEEVTSAKSAD